MPEDAEFSNFPDSLLSLLLNPNVGEEPRKELLDIPSYKTSAELWPELDTLLKKGIAERLEDSKKRQKKYSEGKLLYRFLHRDDSDLGLEIKMHETLLNVADMISRHIQESGEFVPAVDKFPFSLASGIQVYETGERVSAVVPCLTPSKLSAVAVSPIRHLHEHPEDYQSGKLVISEGVIERMDNGNCPPLYDGLVLLITDTQNNNSVKVRINTNCPLNHLAEIYEIRESNGRSQVKMADINELRLYANASQMSRKPVAFGGNLNEEGEFVADLFATTTRDKKFFGYLLENGVRQI